MTAQFDQLGIKWYNLYCIHKVKACRMHTEIDPQQHYYISSVRRSAPIRIQDPDTNFGYMFKVTLTLKI